MGNDVGMLVSVIAQDEADTHTSRVGIGIRVWDVWDSRRAGETHHDRRGGIVEVRRLGKGGCFRGRCEDTFDKSSASVRCALVSLLLLG